MERGIPPIDIFAPVSISFDIDIGPLPPGMIDLLFGDGTWRLWMEDSVALDRWADDGGAV